MFDFDEVVDRKGTNCAKWDTIEANNKPKDVLPMWVADMDFKSPKEIENALVKRINLMDVDPATGKLFERKFILPSEFTKYIAWQDAEDLINSAMIKFKELISDEE